MFESLRAELDSCQLADRHRLHRKLGELEKRFRHAGREPDSQQRSVAELSKSIATSQRACQHRQQAIPKHIDYPSNLPVSAKADEIAELISSNQVLVVAG